MTEDDAGKTMTREQVDLGMAAMGHSIVEVMLKDGKWSIVDGQPAQPPHHRQHRNADLRPGWPAMR